MAQYVEIPKDFYEIKQKVVLGLTKRQAICFGGGGALGIGTYFLTKNCIGTNAATYVLAVVAAPAIVFGCYQKNGLYLEQVIKNMIKFYKAPRIKTYQTENIYEKIEKAMEYRKCQRLLKQATQYTGKEVRNSNAKKARKK